MHPLAQGLQMSSTGILIYVCSYIFGTLWITKRSWFRCLVAGAMTGGVGLIFLLSQTVTAELAVGYGLLVGLAALMPLCYEQLFERRWQSAGTFLALSGFLVGAAAIPLPFGMNLGVVAAVALVGNAVRRTDLFMTMATAAGCGLGLDVAMMTGGVYTLVLCCGGFVGTLMSRRHWPLRVLLFALAFLCSRRLRGCERQYTAVDRGSGDGGKPAAAGGTHGGQRGRNGGAVRPAGGAAAFQREYGSAAAL